MFTTPKIVTPLEKTNRSYISYSYNGKRYREYNGNRLNLNIYPNSIENPKDKKRLLHSLQFEFKKALDSGWHPELLETEKPALKIALDLILKDKLNSNLCDLYKRNLKAVHRMFVDFIPSKQLNDKADHLPFLLVEEFLNKFQTSERNYINRRRCLGTFFNEMIRKGYAIKNPVKQTKTAKAKASLHIPYSQDELKRCLAFLKTDHYNLYLCCMLTYGCLLRPHQEIRQLKLRNIVNDFTQIQLSGSENKSKRVRTVYVPNYIQEILRERLSGISNSEINIFTLNREPYSVGYFNLMWGKVKVKMLKEGIIQPNHTIYSFRHTAAINVYRKTKDLHILQQLLQHSNMIVTLNYLRGLGEINDERLRDVLPEL
jgi:site-specific recombinase XerD